MIFEINAIDRKEYAQAKNELHLLQEYLKEFGEDAFLEIETLKVITKEEAGQIKLINTEYNEDDPLDIEEMTLESQCAGDDFIIIGSTEW